MSNGSQTILTWLYTQLIPNDSTGTRSCYAPICIPLTPDTVRANQLAVLNRRLEHWGYCDNPRDFFHTVTDEYQLASQNGKTLEAWVAQRSEWIGEGDDILDAIEEFICGGYMDSSSLTQAGLQTHWENLTSVVYKVQYMMAAVEVRIDLSM